MDSPSDVTLNPLKESTLLNPSTTKGKHHKGDKSNYWRFLVFHGLFVAWPESTTIALSGLFLCRGVAKS